MCRSYQKKGTTYNVKELTEWERQTQSWNGSNDLIKNMPINHIYRRQVTQVIMQLNKQDLLIITDTLKRDYIDIDITTLIISVVSM